MGEYAKSLSFRGMDRQHLGFHHEREKEWRGPFHFICAADTQFGLIERRLEGKVNPKWDKEIELSKMAVAAANKMKPKPAFFVICGDMIDAFPGTSDREPQYKDFVNVFSKLEMPLICICGNHDVKDRPKPEDIIEYKSKFGDDYFSFICRGVLFIVINSQLYQDSTRAAEEEAEKQDEWLDYMLTKVSQYKHAVIFQHVPWFLYEPHENTIYNSNIERDLRLRILEKLHKAGIRYVFAGHYHRNAGGRYKDLELVITSAIGAQLHADVCDDKSGLRVVRIFESEIDHEYYALDDVPEYVKFE